MMKLKTVYYKLIELRGERGRRVTIILTKYVEKSMQLLVQLRSKVGPQ